MSLKLRLALVNTIFVLIALGLGFFLIATQTRRAFIESIDHDMNNRAMMMARGPGPNQNGPNQGGPGQPGLAPGGGGQGQGAPPAGQDNPPNGGPENQNPGNRMGGQGGPQGQGQGQNQGPDGPPNDDIGRPVRYDENGKAFDSREPRVLDPQALALKEKKHPIFSTVPVEGIPTRVITVAMPPGRPAAFLQFGHDLRDFDRLKETQNTTIFFLLPVSILIAAGVGWILAGRAVKPINDVATASEKISGSDMSTRLAVRGDDEIGRLSTAFNGMVDRLQLSFNERQKLLDELKVALEKQRQFVGDASHELRTPLARIRITTSSALEQESSKEEMKEALEIADRETVHMSNLVDQLLMLARLDSGLTPSVSKVDLSNIAREAFGKFPANITKQIRLEVDSPAFAMVDSEGLVRAAINLIENAARYADGKEIVIRTQVIHGQSVLTVRDHGVGIEPQHLSRLTERFYRVDDARNRKMGGTGLGLAIVKSIVESSGGKLQIHSKPGEGTNVEMSFPTVS